MGLGSTGHAFEHIHTDNVKEIKLNVILKLNLILPQFSKTAPVAKQFATRL
jgi:hypothetical protein